MLPSVANEQDVMFFCCTCQVSQAHSVACMNDPHDLQICRDFQLPNQSIGPWDKAAAMLIHARCNCADIAASQLAWQVQELMMAM